MSLSEQEQDKIKKSFDYLNDKLEASEHENLRLRNQYGQLSTSPPDADSEMAKLQLDCDKIVDQAYHLLSGHILIKDSKGGDKWIEPDDDRLKTLSKNGVYMIMNQLKFYINPNTLLSNFSKEEVDAIVLNFGNIVNDLLFNKAEFFYYHPSPETLYSKFHPIVKQEGLDISDQDLYDKCVQWSYQELQSKFRHHEAIVWQLTDMVYCTYRRAMNGEERRGLRSKQTWLMSQTLSPPQTQPKGGMFK